MEELVRLLRLRHRSYRTEKTYVNWTKRFPIYLNHKSASGVTQSDLTDFLSYLAVAGLHIALAIVNAIGESWVFYIYGTIVEIVFLSLIVWHAWKWHKQEG